MANKSKIKFVLRNLLDRIKRAVNKLIFNVYEIAPQEYKKKQKNTRPQSFQRADKIKIVGLVRSRNEANIIETCMRALTNYTDAIVFYDDASEDNSLDVVQSLTKACRVERIIENSEWFHDGSYDRNMLLEAGRKLGGTHFICLDADELLTSNFIENNFFRSLIKELHFGDRLLLNWIQLWRSTKHYRTDQSIWSNRYFGFIFCDDRKCGYDSVAVHEKRLPNSLSGKKFKLLGNQFGVLHYNFANWRNLRAKQYWYMCLERTKYPDRSVDTINSKYAKSMDESGLQVAPIKPEWLDRYAFFEDGVYNLPETWREKQVLDWFQEYGEDHFAELDIWDIHWNYDLLIK